jgi:hypothetical protein
MRFFPRTIPSRYLTPYTKLANQTLAWLPGDTEERYKQNLILHRDQLRELGWIDADISYSFNSCGFRCAEFTDMPTAMFLGCSHTVGIGMPVDKIWPELVSKALNMSCANLGIGGGSLDTAFRLCHGYIDSIRPKILVLLRPEITRIELFQAPTYEPTQYGAGFDDIDFYKIWLLDDRNHWAQQTKNIMAIRSMCKDRGIRFVDMESGGSRLDLARDLQHGGVETNATTAQMILNLINSKH